MTSCEPFDLVSLFIFLCFLSFLCSLCDSLLLCAWFPSCGDYLVPARCQPEYSELESDGDAEAGERERFLAAPLSVVPPRWPPPCAASAGPSPELPPGLAPAIISAVLLHASGARTTQDDRTLCRRYRHSQPASQPASHPRTQPATQPPTRPARTQTRWPAIATS